VTAAPFTRKNHRIVPTASPAPPLVAALVGEDSFLQLSALADLLRLLPADSQRIDLDGETAQLADALDEARSFAMFGGGGKAVVIRNGDEFVKKYREQLEDYVAAPSDSAMLVLRMNKLLSNTRLYKALEKKGGLIKCEVPKDVAKWIMDRGKSGHKLVIAPDAARMLADLVGADLGRLDNELAKLALTSPSAAISAKDVAGAVAFQREREMWDLTNALAAGNSADAIRRWRQLVHLDSSAEFRAVTWLGIWLENVRKALAMLRDGQNAFAIGQALRIWPREAQQPFVDAVKAMGDAGLDRAVDLLAEIDFQTKTGIGDAVENVERFILTLAVR
jgi:DNA polymerase III delta subunit